jgi:hypothetical protein
MERDHIGRMETPAFIRNLMPEATPKELQAACETVREYLAVVRRIHERLRAEALRDSPESDSLDTIRANQ